MSFSKTNLNLDTLTYAGNRILGSMSQDLGYCQSRIKHGLRICTFLSNYRILVWLEHFSCETSHGAQDGWKVRQEKDNSTYITGS